jgi:hypothetical protein
MEEILKKVYFGIITYFQSIQALETPSQPNHPDL